MNEENKYYLNQGMARKSETGKNLSSEWQENLNKFIDFKTQTEL